MLQEVRAGVVDNVANTIGEDEVMDTKAVDIKLGTLVALILELVLTVVKIKDQQAATTCNVQKRVRARSP